MTFDCTWELFMCQEYVVLSGVLGFPFLKLSSASHTHLNWQHSSPSGPVKIKFLHSGTKCN